MSNCLNAAIRTMCLCGTTEPVFCNTIKCICKYKPVSNNMFLVADLELPKSLLVSLCVCCSVRQLFSEDAA